MTAEEALLPELDAHDALVHRCVRGELSWAEFVTAYDCFYITYPLDGHESDAEELAAFARHADRIALHHDIWEQVILKVTDDVHVERQEVLDAGYIGSREAVRRLQALWRRYGRA